MKTQCQNGLDCCGLKPGDGNDLKSHPPCLKLGKPLTNGLLTVNKDAYTTVSVAYKRGGGAGAVMRFK